MKVLIFSFLVIFSFSNLNAASIPPLINYQGTLTNAQGQPIINETRKLTFNIYDSATGGSLVWGPQVFDPVPVISGMFNVILGTTDTGGRSIADAFGEGTRFLGITVDEAGQNGGSEVIPRQQILSAPFAVQAQNTILFDNHPPQWFAPVGTIVAFWGAEAPDGWLICDGSVIDTEHANLIALVGDNVPDLRGVFLRGLDSGKGYDPDRGLGTYQDDDFKSHAHTLTVHHSPYATSGIGGAYGSSPANTHSTNPYGGDETRPKNVSVNYIIKY